MLDIRRDTSELIVTGSHRYNQTPIIVPSQPPLSKAAIQEMSASVQDVFMLFGDSITQGGWEPGVNGFGQRLSRMFSELSP